MTFKQSLHEILFWKETFDEWNYFIFLKKNKTKQKLKKNMGNCSQININNNFLPSNRNEAIEHTSIWLDALKTKRFQMMFIVWHST